jgi:DNA-binding GntR family transcriptional regulator
MLAEKRGIVQHVFGAARMNEMTFEQFAPLDRQTLGARAYLQIADLMIAGKLAPGEKLSLRTTADALHVSMTPVREAVARLVSDGALEITPGRSIRVPIMSASQFRDLTKARIAIEGHTAAEAAHQRSDEDIARLREADRAFGALRRLRRPDLAQAVELNKEFHFVLYAAAGSAILIDIIRSLWLKAGPVLNLDLRANRNRIAKSRAVEFHAAALEAVIAGNAEAARNAIAEDIGTAADFILSHGRLVDA